MLNVNCGVGPVILCIPLPLNSIITVGSLGGADCISTVESGNSNYLHACMHNRPDKSKKYNCCKKP